MPCPSFDLGAECRAIAEQFGSVVGQARSRAGGSPGGPADPGIVPSNIVVLLPFALCDGLAGRDGLQSQAAVDAARAMALGNVFGAAHFLVQDRWLDGDEPVDPAGARLSDLCLTRFTRAYHDIVPDDPAFRDNFDRYLEECHESLAWERRVLCSDGGGRAVGAGELDETLTMLGRKMSPLKSTVVAAASLSGTPDALALGERIVEDYHAAYQLADDIDDLAADLAASRWSVVAWFLATRGGLDSPREAGGAVELLRCGARSGALEELVELVCSRYRRAASSAIDLGAPMLESYLRESLLHAERVLGRMARRATITERGGGNGSGRARALSPGVKSEIDDGSLHGFEVDGDAFVYDRRSGLFFEADGTAVDVMAWFRAGAGETALDVLRLDHGVESIEEAVREVAFLAGGDPCGLSPCDGPSTRGRLTRGRLTREHRTPSLGGLSSVALNVAAGCNLACDYCYLGPGGGGPRSDAPGLMTDEVAFRAVDLLFDESFGEREMSVVFFGGEPLLNAGLIARTARHARHRAARDTRRVSFHTTTNGTLLTPDVAAMLHAEGVRMLVSIDGPPDSHDAHRTYRNGAGSYDTIAANIQRLSEGMRPGARATVTPDSAPLAEIVAHLRELGFGVVHLAPVSDGPMDAEFAESLIREYEELARREREVVLGGGSPGAGCFIEPMVSLELGRQRLSPCGAGARYVSVASDGGLYLCHRFAGDERYRVGDVGLGLDRSAVGRLLGDMAARSSACTRCWALGLCGGACFHDIAGEPGRFAGPDSQRCRVRLRTLELSMWLYASLPGELRARLSERARAAARP